MGKDLLTAAQRALFQNAVGDVLATFYKHPVVYVQRIQGSAGMGRWGEHRATGEAAETKHELEGLVSYPGTGEDEEEFGTGDVREITVGFGYDTLAAAGLIDEAARAPVFTVGGDYIEHAGERWNIVDIKLDGPFEDRHLLVEVVARRDETKV